MTTWRDTTLVHADDLVRLRDRLFLSVGDVRRKCSAFWVLLVSALGLRQQADLSGLKEELNEAGLEAYDVDVILVLGGTRDAEIDDPRAGGGSDE